MHEAKKSGKACLLILLLVGSASATTSDPAVEASVGAVCNVDSPAISTWSAVKGAVCEDGGGPCPDHTISCPAPGVPNFDCEVGAHDGSYCSLGPGDEQSTFRVSTATPIGPTPDPVEEVLAILAGPIEYVMTLCCIPPLPGNYYCNRHESTFDNVYLYSGASIEHYDNPGESNAIVGTPGDDYIDGADGDDCIYGGDGDDYLFGGIGNDHVFGHEGDDLVAGNYYGYHPAHPSCGAPYLGSPLGKNFVFGGEGHDTVVGCEGDDYLIGGAGNDEIIGFGGNDLMGGRAGDDLLFGGSGGNEDNYPVRYGHSIISGDSGNDLIYGSRGNDEIEGGSGADTIHGMAGDDTLYGGPGEDLLYGMAGNDLLYGGSGWDHLDGGTGTDSGYGGTDEGSCDEVETMVDCYP